MIDWMDVGDAALRYDLSGEGPSTLVLVHEMGGTLESWDGVLPHVRPGRTVLRYDTRGAGQSEKLRGPVSLDAMTADLNALLATLNLNGPVALAGCAVGAAIAMRFCVQHPERVSALIAMAPATGVPPDRRAATLARAADMEQLGPRGVIEDSFALSYPPEVRRDSETYRIFRARWLANDARSYASIYRMLAGATLNEELDRISCPALVLAGEHDRLRPPAMVEPLARRIQNARFAAIDSGHFMAVQTPTIVADEIGRFLAGLGL